MKKLLLLLALSTTLYAQEEIQNLPRERSKTNGIVFLKLPLTDDIYSQLLCIKILLNETNQADNAWIKDAGTNYIKVVLTESANGLLSQNKLSLAVWINQLGNNEKDKLILKRIMAIKEEK